MPDFLFSDLSSPRGVSEVDKRFSSSPRGVVRGVSDLRFSSRFFFSASAFCCGVGSGGNTSIKKSLIAKMDDGETKSAGRFTTK